MLLQPRRLESTRTEILVVAADDDDGVSGKNSRILKKQKKSKRGKNSKTNYEKEREGGGRNGGNEADDEKDGGDRSNSASDAEDSDDRSNGSGHEGDGDDWSLPLAGRGWSIAQAGKGQKKGRKDNLQRSRRVQVVEGEQEEPSTPLSQRRPLFRPGGAMIEQGATPESTHVPSRAMLNRVKSTLPCWKCKKVGDLCLHGASGRNRTLRCRNCNTSRSGKGLLEYAEKERQRVQQCEEAGIPASRQVEVPEDLRAGESWPALIVVEGEKGETDRKVLVPEDTLLELVL
jgi:hypothetical protein